MAFEMARQLYARGAAVALVSLLDSVAPRRKGRVVSDNAALLAGFAVNLGVPMNLLFAAPDELLRSGIQAQLNWVLDQARRAQVLPPDVGIEDLRHRFELYRADIEAVENYRPPPTPIPLVLLRASDEGDCQVETPDSTTGWNRLSTKLEVHSVPGDHLTMMRPPHLFTLAEILRKQFAKAEQTKPNL